MLSYKKRGCVIVLTEANKIINYYINKLHQKVIFKQAKQPAFLAYLQTLRDVQYIGVDCQPSW